MLAPHLDSSHFMDRQKDVVKHGSVLKAERACTPTKPYNIPYVQSKKVMNERVNMWPPGTGPAPDEKKVKEYLKEGYKLEREAAKIVENRDEHAFQRTEKQKRRGLLHSEAERYYTMASTVGSPLGERAIRKMKGRSYEPSEAERVKTAQALYRPSVPRRPNTSLDDSRPSPLAFIAKMAHQRKKEDVMKAAGDVIGSDPRVFESTSSPKGKVKVVWDSDSDGGIPEPLDPFEGEGPEEVAKWFD